MPTRRSERSKHEVRRLLPTLLTNPDIVSQKENQKQI